MAGQRSKAVLGVVIAAAIAVAYADWVRPRILNCGATMATTLPAPQESVWPWLVQMGVDRGGWYSRDWLDNNGSPSADRIVPECQDPGLGQQLSRVAAPGQEPGSFTVVALEPSRTLVLKSDYGFFTGRDFDPHPGSPATPWVEGIWGFHLRPTPGGGTRLVVRSRNRGGPRVVARPFVFLLGEPMHFAMQTRQFRNLRRRVTEHR